MLVPCVANEVGKSLRRALKTVEEAHATEPSNLSVQPKLYFLELPPVVLILLLMTKGRKMQPKRRPVGPLYSIF